MSVTPLILLYLVLGWIAARLAKKKHRNPTGWFFAGVFFGIIAILVLFFLRPLKKAGEEQEIVVEAEEPLAMISNKLWYYLDKEEKRHGPMSESLLRGSIDEAVFVWNEDMADWKPAKEIFVPTSSP